MIELKLEPYCKRCSEFEAETRHHVLFYGDGICEDQTTIICEKANKCRMLYTYIENEIREKCTPLNGDL